jgi:hypothetical protein
MNKKNKRYCRRQGAEMFGKQPLTTYGSTIAGTQIWAAGDYFYK